MADMCTSCPVSRQVVKTKHKADEAINKLVLNKKSVIILMRLMSTGLNPQLLTGSNYFFNNTENVVKPTANPARP
jgi:hypothetical protein